MNAAESPISIDLAHEADLRIGSLAKPGLAYDGKAEAAKRAKAGPA